MSCYGILCNKKNHTNNNLRRIISMDRRSSRSQMFFKIGALKNFANFTEKHLCWSLFLIKLQAWRTLIKETPTQMFSLWNLRNFYQHLFLQITFGGCFCMETDRVFYFDCTYNKIVTGAFRTQSNIHKNLNLLDIYWGSEYASGKEIFTHQAKFFES